MLVDSATLPDSADALKDMVASLLEVQGRYENENRLLREQVRHLLAKLYGRKLRRITINDGQDFTVNDGADWLNQPRHCD